MLPKPMTTDLFEKITLQEKEALKFGFYWESVEQLLNQIESECEEIKTAWQKKDYPNLKEEIGDLISATISLCIFLKLDPLETLKESVEKFQIRYDTLVALVQKDGLENLVGKPMDVLMHYWDQAKQKNT